MIKRILSWMTILVITSLLLCVMPLLQVSKSFAEECTSCSAQGTVASSDDPATPNLDESLGVSPEGQSDIYLIDRGWSTATATYDCVRGWGNDRWHLTLTKPRSLTINVMDCCCPGDFYEVYVNNELIGTTPNLDKWGCSHGWVGPLSSGSFTLNLTAGVYVVNIRDAGFDMHTQYEIMIEQMCPAGYTVTGTLGPYVDPSAWRKDIQVGDLLFHRTHGVLSVLFEWTHSGMYAGDGWVAEARGESEGGIDTYPVTDWDYPRDKYVALKSVFTATPEKRQAAAQWDLDEINQPNRPTYWLNFTQHKFCHFQSHWYCSELNWAGYYNQDIDLDAIHSLYEEKYPCHIHGAVAPQDLYDSSQTVLIGSHKEVDPRPGGTIPNPPTSPYAFTVSDPYMLVLLLSPVDVAVTDPEGLTTSKISEGIPGALYIEYGYAPDKTYDAIVLPDRKMGYYLITVTPEPDALPSDTYTLVVSGAGSTVIVADNVPISDIPSGPYVLRSTASGIDVIIPATVDFDPDTLNLKSKGQWVTAYIEPSAGYGYDISQIKLSSVKLNGQVQADTKPTAIGDYDKDGIPDLMVKFDRSAVQSILPVGDKVEVTIGGTLNDGRQFEGKDTIKVIGDKVVVR